MLHKLVQEDLTGAVLRTLGSSGQSPNMPHSERRFGIDWSDQSPQSTHTCPGLRECGDMFVQAQTSLRGTSQSKTDLAPSFHLSVFG